MVENIVFTDKSMNSISENLTNSDLINFNYNQLTFLPIGVAIPYPLLSRSPPICVKLQSL